MVNDLIASSEKEKKIKIRPAAGGQSTSKTVKGWVLKKRGSRQYHELGKKQKGRRRGKK